MTDYEKIIEEIKANAVESSIKRYERQNEPKPYYGVAMGTLTKIAKPYLKQNDLAAELWKSGILEGQLLAVQIVDPKSLDADTLWTWCDQKVSLLVLDKLVTRVISVRKDAGEFEKRLLEEESPVLQRMGWGLTTRRVIKGKLKEEELEEIFAKIKKELPKAEEPLKWSINHCLCEIGVYYDDWTERCIDFGRENGAYKEMKVAKGCTSAYAPEWIVVAKRNREKRMKK
ncbi:MAG: DNA alkylation repair protein [Gallicola sp.]|nr:DNA alkylation repair protein [Gallicola sp.]